MARRLVLMPVEPSMTVSEAANFWPRVCSASALRMALGKNQAAPAALTERRNSRRCIGPPGDGGVFMRLHQIAGCGKERARLFGSVAWAKGRKGRDPSTGGWTLRLGAKSNPRSG